jgi:hypothetical protein
MRGDDNLQEGIFSYISPEKRVPADHPLRPIRKMVDEILKEMSPQFAKLYSNVGRPSIAPERLLSRRTASRLLLSRLKYSVRLCPTAKGISRLTRSFTPEACWTAENGNGPASVVALTRQPDADSLACG